MTLSFFPSLAVARTTEFFPPAAERLRDITHFFKNLFSNPEKHMIAVAVICVVVIGIVIGIVFLIMKIFRKCHPKMVHDYVPNKRFLPCNL